MIVLGSRLGDYLYRRADPITTALGSLQSDRQPVSRAIGAVHPNLCWFEQRRYHGVHSAIAVEVPERAPSMPRRGCRRQSCFGDQRFPPAARARVAKHHVVLLDLCSRFWQRFDVAPQRLHHADNENLHHAEDQSRCQELTERDAPGGQRQRHVFL